MVSGNITATISDHLSQFVFAFNVLSKALCQKLNIYQIDWSKFIQHDFIHDYFDKDWSDVLQLDQQDVNLSIEPLLGNMNSILDEHAPLKGINRYKLKLNLYPLLFKNLSLSKPIY